MTDPSVKKVIVNKEDLPAFSVEEQSYLIRYRIVSQDKNRYSHWSPFHSVGVPSKNSTSEQVQCAVSVLNDVVTMTWKQPSTALKQFDIYFKYDSQDWKYVSSSATTQFSTLLDSSVSSIMVAVQVPTYPKKYSVDAAIFTSAPIAV